MVMLNKKGGVFNLSPFLYSS